MNEEKTIELETQLVYQDYLVKELNDIVYRQQQQIDLLEEKVALLADQIKNLSALSGNISDEKPPHY